MRTMDADTRKRVEGELADIHAKVGRLAEFIRNYRTGMLSLESIGLLSRQLSIMKSYEEVLGDRLRLDDRELKEASDGKRS